MMQTALNVLQWTVRVVGVIQIILGLLFWTGNAVSLVPLHMLLGLIIVILLWVVAIMAWRAGVPPALPIVGLVWGAVTLWLGLTQAQIMPGSNHWIIQVVHLLLGLGALGQAEVLIQRMKRGQTSTLAA